MLVSLSCAENDIFSWVEFHFLLRNHISVILLSACEFLMVPNWRQLLLLAAQIMLEFIRQNKSQSAGGHIFVYIGKIDRQLCLNCVRTDNISGQSFGQTNIKGSDGLLLRQTVVWQSCKENIFVILTSIMARAFATVYDFSFSSAKQIRFLVCGAGFFAFLEVLLRSPGKSSCILKLTKTQQAHQL